MSLTPKSAVRIAVLVVVTFLLGSVAAAAPARAAGTRQFTVLNLSSKNIKLVSVETLEIQGKTTQKNAELPPVNSIYVPGDEPAFELDNNVATNRVRVKFIALDNTQQQVGAIVFAMALDSFGVRYGDIESQEGTVEGSNEIQSEPASVGQARPDLRRLRLGSC